MRLVFKYRDRPYGKKPYLCNREPFSEQACERIAADCGMTPMQVAIDLGIGMALRGADGRSYRLRS